MRTSWLAFFFLLLIATSAGRTYAQDGAAESINIEDSEPVAHEGPPLAYETATLPKDRAAAWQMLREANGLHDDTLKPWYVAAHNKTYDAYGHSKGEGTLDYTWAGRNSWKVIYTEGARVWTRWKTAQGIYAPAGQPDSPGYPESLITGQLRDPLRHVGVPTEVPPYLSDENFASTMTLTCFLNRPKVPANGHPSGLPVQFCSAQGRPILRYAQSDYSGFYNKSVGFQHRIVAEQINLRDDDTPVLDIDVDSLKAPDASHLEALTPPADAVLIRDTTLFVPASMVHGHPIDKKQPAYPVEMKQERVQGAVRLAALIGADGKVTITDVLHSPAPALTKSAEEAVSHWSYAPSMKDGQPVAVQTTITVRYRLGR